MKSLVVAALHLVVSTVALAVEPASYFRVWQGMQKADLSRESFLNQLPPFMKETVDLYKNRALNNYIVVVPPALRPTYVPDELALVALSSQEAYRQVRSTPEGQRYSDRHWDIFDRAKSQSASNFVNASVSTPSDLSNNWAYDMIGDSIDWSTGINFVYIRHTKGLLSFI